MGALVPAQAAELLGIASGHFRLHHHDRMAGTLSRPGPDQPRFTALLTYAAALKGVTGPRLDGFSAMSPGTIRLIPDALRGTKPQAHPIPYAARSFSPQLTLVPARFRSSGDRPAALATASDLTMADRARPR